MQQTPTNSVMISARIVVANVLPSAASFGVRLDNGDNCYIPSSVSKATDAHMGMEYEAKLVRNRYPDKVDQTPWLVVHMSKAAPKAGVTVPVQYAMPFEQSDTEPETPPPPPQPSVADRVRATMADGGVWTLASLFEELFPDATRSGNMAEYNAISTAIRAMYAKGECAKFQLWRSSDQSKPSREWFTCHPDRADVDEWD